MSCNGYHQSSNRLYFYRPSILLMPWSVCHSALEHILRIRSCCGKFKGFQICNTRALKWQLFQELKCQICLTVCMIYCFREYEHSTPSNSHTYNFGYINIIVSLNPWGKTYYHSKNIYLCSITENVFLIKIEHISGIFVYDNGKGWKMYVLSFVMMMMMRATLHLTHVSSNCLFLRWNVLFIYFWIERVCLIHLVYMEE